MTTIKDVARLAGVSTATVSRMLSKPDVVSADAQVKINAAIKETGYVANSLARSFRTKKSYSVLVLVPNIANIFFAEIIQGIELVAQEKGYRILLGDTQYDAERESTYSQLLSNKHADGIISLGRTLPAFAVTISQLNVPLVMGCEFGEDGGPYSVCIDNEQAAFEATAHLIGLGHREIALINAPTQSPLAKERRLGFERAMSESALKVTPDLVVHGGFTMTSGAEQMDNLLATGKPFTAVFAANDEMAIGAIKALKGRGLRVPEDVSVVGFDDIPFAAFSSPSLTTIRQPRKEMGRELMRSILEVMAGKALVPSDGSASEGRLVLAHHLVERESSARCPGSI